MLDFYVSPIDLPPIIFDNEAAATSNAPPPFSQTFEGVSNTAVQPSLIVQNQDAALMVSSDSDLSMATQTQEIFSGLSNEEWEDLQTLVFSDVSDQHVTKAAVTTVSSSQDRGLNSLPAKNQSDSLSQQERLLQVEHQLLAEFKADTSQVPRIVKILRIWESNLSLSAQERVQFLRFVGIFDLLITDLTPYIEVSSNKLRKAGRMLLNQFDQKNFSIEERKLMTQFARANRQSLGLLQTWQSNLQLPEDKRVSFERFSEILAVRMSVLSDYIDRYTYAFKDLALRVFHTTEFQKVVSRVNKRDLVGAFSSVDEKVINALKVWQNNLQVPATYRMKLQQFIDMLDIPSKKIFQYVSKDTGIINAQGLAILDCAKQASINEAHFPADQHQLRMQFANASLKILQLLQAWQGNLQRPENQRVNLKQFSNIYKIHYCHLTPYIQGNGSFKDMGLDILQKATIKEKEITFFSIENKIEQSIQAINESDEFEKIAQSFFSSEEWGKMESDIMMLLDS